jgi:hypothetical protein
MQRKYPLVVMMLVMFVWAGCARTQLPKRATPSTARIGTVVTNETLFAGGVADEVSGDLRQRIIESQIGVPVMDNDKADLLLNITIDSGNLSKVTAWEWQLIDVDTGAIVLARTESSVLGAGAETISDGIMVELTALDTSPYAGAGASAVVPVKPAPVQLVAPASQTDGQKAWAVVVGIERYRNDLTPATGAERDARAFAEFAHKTLGVPEANIKVLIGESASRADMSGALLEWLPRNAVESGGRVYVFFSGHGAPDVESGDAYLVPYDANPAYLKTGGFSLSGLQETLAGLNGQQVYVFLDACFSGQGDRSVLAEGTRPLVPVKAVGPVGSVVTFSASAASETTGAHATSGHGLFTHALLEGMAGAADADRDGNISLAELKAHVIDQVRTGARRQNRDQTPSVVTPSGLDLNQALLIRGLDR